MLPLASRNRIMQEAGSFSSLLAEGQVGPSFPQYELNPGRWSSGGWYFCLLGLHPCRVKLGLNICSTGQQRLEMTVQDHQLQPPAQAADPTGRTRLVSSSCASRSGPQSPHWSGGPTTLFPQDSFQHGFLQRCVSRYLTKVLCSTLIGMQGPRAVERVLGSTVWSS